MFKKILVPLDGSKLAEKALTQALEMALCSGAEILLLRVPVYNWEGIGMATTLPGAMPPQFLEQGQQTWKRAEAYLGAIRKELEERELAVSVHVENGEPAETILRCAQEENVDLIVMCTHGRSGLGRMVFGSVADQVVRGARVPLLLMR